MYLLNHQQGFRIPNLNYFISIGLHQQHSNRRGTYCTHWVLNLGNNLKLLIRNNTVKYPQNQLIIGGYLTISLHRNTLPNELECLLIKFNYDSCSVMNLFMDLNLKYIYYLLCSPQLKYHIDHSWGCYWRHSLGPSIWYYEQEELIEQTRKQLGWGQ